MGPKARLKCKHFRGDLELHGINDAETVAVVVEHFVELRVPPSAESVGKNIEVGRNPFGFPLEVVPNLCCSEVLGHLQTVLVPSSSVLKEVEACGRVCFPGPAGAPDIPGEDVGQQLEIRNDPVLEFGQGGAGNIFVSGKVENTDTWQPPVPTVRAGVLRDVGGGGGLQERDTVAERNGLDLPVNVSEEGGVKDDAKTRGCGSSFCGEDSVEEKSTRRDDSSRVDKFAGQ